MNDDEAPAHVKSVIALDHEDVEMKDVKQLFDLMQ